MDLYAGFQEGVPGLLVASDAASVAHRHAPGGQPIRRVRARPGRLADPATLIRAVDEARVPMTAMGSPLDALRHPAVERTLRSWGCHGYEGPAGRGHAMLVSWEAGSVETLPETATGQGRISVEPDALSVELTTSGRQLVLDLHREGLGVAMAAMDDTHADPGPRARRHVAAWLLAACDAPAGVSLAVEGDAVVTTSAAGRASYHIGDLDADAAADLGLFALPAGGAPCHAGLP